MPTKQILTNPFETVKLLRSMLPPKIALWRVRSGQFILPVALLLAGALQACQSVPGAADRLPVESALKMLEPGVDKATVRRLLGEPDSADYYRRLNEEVWRYQQATSGGDDLLISFALDETVKEILQVPYVAPRIFGFDD
jgi:hypothetical protein